MAPLKNWDAPINLPSQMVKLNHIQPIVGMLWSCLGVGDGLSLGLPDDCYFLGGFWKCLRLEEMDEEDRQAEVHNSHRYMALSGFGVFKVVQS